MSITDDELALLDRYAASYKAFLTAQFKARSEAGSTAADDIFNIDSVAVQQFNQQDYVMQRNALFRRLKEKLAAKREQEQRTEGKVAAQDKRVRKIGPRLSH